MLQYTIFRGQVKAAVAARKPLIL